MAGTPGNPNHDPKSGRFTSKSGLNRNNSTVVQRGKSNIKEHISAGKAFAGAAVAAAAGAAGAAALQGFSRPIRARANLASHALIKTSESLVAKHGPSAVGALKNAIPFVVQHAPTIARAISGKGSSLANHVKNMKSAGALQHKSTSSVSSKSSDYRIAPRPRVRHKGA